VRSGTANNRRFGYAIAISVAAHAVALYGGLPLLRESFEEPAVPTPLVTRLVELPKPVAAEPVAPPPAAAKKAPPRPETAKPVPQPAPVAEPSPQPAPPAPPRPQPAEAPVAAAPAAAPALPQVDSRAAEAATAAQYRLQLIEAARRTRPPYPTVARENNWTGEAILDIVVRADGRAELGLRRSSGHPVLDRLALDTYQQALRIVPVPPALQGRQVRLEPLRVIYSLTEN
jgi:protein TonB